MMEILQDVVTNEYLSFLKGQFDDMPLGIFITDRQGIISYMNRNASSILGYQEPADASGSSLRDIDAVLNTSLMNSLSQIIEGRNLVLPEHRCSNRQGHFATLNVYVSPFRRQAEETLGIIGILQDVTGSARRKAELEEAILELSILAEVSEALSSTADLDEVLRIILTGVTANQGLGFNRAFLFLIDTDGAYLEGKVAIGPSSPEEAGEIWSRLSRQQKSLKEMLEDYSDRENLSNYSLSSLISGWRIPLASETFFSRALQEGMGINVTGRDELPEPSREIMRRLHTVNLAVAPIISKDKKLGIIAADNQITGKRISSSDVKLLQTFANHTAVAIERSRLYDNLVEHAAELELINRQLAESQEQMIRVEKMSVIGELTSSIAHELRNPLTVIGGFANLMLSTSGMDGNSEYLNIILAETKRAETVLHHVLDFSRASRTKTRLIDFNQLVSSTVELLNSKMRHRHNPPTMRLTERRLPVWGNPDQLQHALLQFMLISMEELTDGCNVIISTVERVQKALMKIDFSGGDQAKPQIIKTLKQIFGSSTGTQKLSIIVAGETLRYHGGNYGIENVPNEFPRIYVELPQYKGGTDEETSCG